MDISTLRADRRRRRLRHGPGDGRADRGGRRGRRRPRPARLRAAPRWRPSSAGRTSSATSPTTRAPRPCSTKVVDGARRSRCSGQHRWRRDCGADVSKDGPHDLTSFRQVVDLNLVATFNLNRLQALHMSKNEPNEDGERGVIINTSSIAAFEGQIGQVALRARRRPASPGCRWRWPATSARSGSA